MRLLDSPISSDDSDPEEEPEEEEDEPSRKPNSESSSSEIATPTAAVYRSRCTESTAKSFQNRYGVPPEYGLCAPTSDQRANDPPLGYSAIYTRYFQNGLKLPLPPFVVSILANYRIALAQLHPNGFITLLGFMEIAEKVSVTPTVNLFRQFFRLVKSGRNLKGWYSFYPMRPKIVFGQADTVHGWKSSFLFFKTEDNASLSWNYSTIVDPPLAEQERPPAETVSKFIAYTNDSSKRKRAIEPEETGSKLTASAKDPSKRKRAVEPEEEERMIEDDVLLAALIKSANCGQKKLKRMSESHATKAPIAPPGKKCMDDDSRVLLVPSLKNIAPEQFARYIQKCVCSFNLQLQGDKEELERTVAAREEDIKDRDKKIASLEAEVSRLRNVCDDRGNLLKVYTSKLLKSLGFAKFFKDLTASVRSLGRHEAAKLVQKRYPAIPKEVLDGLEFPLAAAKLDNQFFSMIQDGGFKFPLLDHLLSLEEIPSSSQLKVLDVDVDKDALIAPKPLPAKQPKPERIN